MNNNTHYINGLSGLSNLQWSREVELATKDLYSKVDSVISPLEWQFHAPYIKAINDLKKQKNAIILAHNYQTPEIYNCVADFVGDSLQLARLAAKSSADIILQCGVYFMAETSKILNLEKMVLIPDKEAGCSLASSISAEDVRGLRKKYPKIPIVCYVNTSADVKAEVDICCTSSNALEIVESLGSEEVIFLPDKYLAANIAKQTNIKIISWDGVCEVHERFSSVDLLKYRGNDKDIKIIAHPECPSDVVDIADFSGSTSQMIKYVKEKRPKKVMLITECSMADNVASEVRDVEFMRPCNICPYMKKITLPKILDSLINLRDEVIIDTEIAKKARLSIQRMLDCK